MKIKKTNKHTSTCKQVNTPSFQTSACEIIWTDLI